MPDIDLEQVASQPKRVRVDDTSAEQHPIPDQIAAVEFQNRQEAAARTGLPFRMALFRPPGAI